MTAGHTSTTAGGIPIRLFCVPHAGGSATTFSGWQDELGPDVAVVPAELPGRDSRRTEPPRTDVHHLACDLAERLSPCCGHSYALFGHSMGAIVAFEIVRLLVGARVGPPQRLFVSASPAPDDQALPAEPLHRLPDDELLSRLAELGGIPRQAAADPELSKFLLPRLRSDCTAAENYTFTPATKPLPCPISVLGGQWDPLVDTGRLRGWRRFTAAETTIRVFPGGHFFLDDNRSLIARALRKDLLTAQVR